MTEENLPQIEDDQDDVEGHRIKPLGDESGIPRNAADSRTGAPHKVVDDDEDDVAGHMVRRADATRPRDMDK